MYSVLFQNGKKENRKVTTRKNSKKDKHPPQEKEQLQ